MKGQKGTFFPKKKEFSTLAPYGKLFIFADKNAFLTFFSL